ncbi:MAG: hypothetical protein WA842_06300 [Croceibacterium sp.]
MTVPEMSKSRALQIVTDMLTELNVSIDRPNRTLRPSDRLSFDEIFANRIGLGQAAKALLTARRARQHFAFSFMLSDPAWDILLELFHNWSDGKVMRFKDVTLSTGVPCATALRYLQMMADTELLTRRCHATDARVKHYEISPKGVIEVGTYLSSAGRTPIARVLSGR